MPRPIAHHGDTSRRPIQMMPITTPVAISVSTQVYPVAIENAAPELRTSVQVTVSPMIDTGCPGVSSLTASTLVTMSRASTTPATVSSRRQPAAGPRRGVHRGGHRLGSGERFVSHSPIIPKAECAMMIGVTRLVVITTGGTIATSADTRREAPEPQRRRPGLRPRRARSSI